MIVLPGEFYEKKLKQSYEGAGCVKDNKAYCTNVSLAILYVQRYTCVNGFPNT